MQNKLWTRWIMQTARRWEDISSVIQKTGVNVVDKDHRMMIECALELNKLIDEMEASSISLDLIDRQKHLLSSLFDITKAHFRREEELINRFGIDGITTQRREHAVILKMLKECLDKFNAGQITVSIELKQSILSWVVHHINEIDYKVFGLPNWRGVLKSAETWEDVTHIITPTGIDFIDEQHKELVTTSLSLNKYISGFTKKNNKVILDDEGQNIFEKLLSCVTRHFADEEAFIKKFNLEDLELQEDKHESFLKLIENFRNDLMSGKSENISTVKTVILEWWINHINEVDINSYSLEKCGLKIIQNAENIEDITGLIRKSGIKLIDDEHENMVKASMTLSGNLDKDSDAFAHSKNQSMLKELLRIAETHFRHEESIMHKHNLQGIKEHADLHKDIISSLKEISQQIEAHDLVFSSSVRAKILDWWVNHTNGADYIMFKDVDVTGSTEKEVSTDGR